MKTLKTRPDTFTRLLSCKPVDVELRRLKYEALRKRAGLKNKGQLSAEESALHEAATRTASFMRQP